MPADADSRPDPDALLAELAAPDTSRGKLKVFLGMCPGAGKTYAMLEAARREIQDGRDVAAGVVETHGRAETQALTEGLEIIPLRKENYRGVTLQEMDLDALLARRPDLAAVDELAHTNIPGSRHPKRYQDVLELLAAGIDVYTTLNVQHLESRADVVRQITGAVVRETVPDSVVDQADEIELIDISPAQLRQRLEEGKVYLGDRAATAAENFFTSGNLTALREMALRYTAEKVDQELRQFMRSRRIRGPWRTQECLLVAAGPSPHSESLIRWTRRTAGMLDCRWIVVHIDTGAALSPKAKERLTRHLDLARVLGAKVLTTTGEDVVEAILRVARAENVTQMIIGKTDNPPWRRWFRASFAERLIAGSGSIDVHVVRPELSGMRQAETPAPERTMPEDLRGYGWGVLLAALATAVNLALMDLTGYWAVALLYLLLIVLSTIWLKRGPVLLLAGLSALAWNFLFIPPRFTFAIHAPHDFMMFAMFFIVALVMGHYASRLRTNELIERRRERRTGTLLSFTQTLSRSADLAAALKEAIQQIDALFGVRTAILRREGPDQLQRRPVPGSTFQLTEKEWSVAAWCFSHREPAGKMTQTLPDAQALYLPLRTNAITSGVLAVEAPRETTFDLTERDLLESFAAQLANTLEKEHFLRAVQEAELAEKSHQLRKSLLDSVSHELKTPIAALQTATEQLEARPENAKSLAGEIKVATQRLHRLVDHLLEMARLDSGTLRPNLEWSDPGDLIHGAIQSLRAAYPNGQVKLDLPELPLLRTDPVLFPQIVSNLVHNAFVHAPDQPVEISARVSDGTLQIDVRDHGPGIPEEERARIFQKFYRLPGAPAGGSGLGLSIAMGFTKALGGELEAIAPQDERDGACFRLQFPVPPAPDHE